MDGKCILQWIWIYLIQYWYYWLMADTVFDLFIAFQNGETNPEDLKFQALFL